VLTGGLGYVDDPADGGTTPGSGSDTTPGGSGGSTPDDGTDDDSGDGADGDGTDGSDGAGGSGGSAPPVTTVGPNGERLVRSTAFRSLGSSFWGVDCSTNCRGVML